MPDNPAIERLFERYGPAYRWYATVTVMLGTLSVVLASTINNVAVPANMAEYRLEQERRLAKEGMLGVDREFERELEAGRVND